MFLKIISKTIFLLIIPYVLLSQQRKLDSLLLQWKEQERIALHNPSTLHLDLLNGIARQYQSIASDSCIRYAQQAIKYARILQHKPAEALAYSTLAKLYYVKSEYNVALKYIIITHNISQAIQDKAGIANASNVLGLIYLEIGNFSGAKKELQKAISINAQIKNQERLSANYFNLGLIFTKQHQADSSFVYFQKSLDLSTKLHNLSLIAIINNHLGDYYLEKKQISKAEKLYNSIIQNPDFQSDWENSFAYTGLAKCFYERQNYPMAIQEGLQGLALAKRTHTKWDIMQALAILHQSYHQAGQFDEAYRYLKLHKQYSDSIFNENKNKEINYLQLIKTQADNKILQQQKEVAEHKEANGNMLILIAIILVVSLLIILFILYRNAQKKQRLYLALQKKSEEISIQKQLIEEKNQALQASNQTKNKLFSIIGHDLRTPFATILSSLQLFKSDILKEEDRQLMLDKVYEQALATAGMLEHLLTWAHSQKEGLQTHIQPTCITDVIEQIINVFVSIAQNKSILLLHDYTSPVYIQADPNQIHILFQNLIANALKFTDVGGIIHISYTFDNEKVSITVKDDGVGMSQEKLQKLFQESGKQISTIGTNNEKGLGIGLTLVKQFADLNHAHISVVSQEQQGTTFIVTFPLGHEA